MVGFHGRCKHFRIDVASDGHYVVVGNERTFPSLNELVGFHHHHAITDEGDTLVVPCPNVPDESVLTQLTIFAERNDPDEGAVSAGSVRSCCVVTMLLCLHRRRAPIGGTAPNPDMRRWARQYDPFPALPRRVMTTILQAYWCRRWGSLVALYAGALSSRVPPPALGITTPAGNRYELHGWVADPDPYAAIMAVDSSLPPADRIELSLGNGDRIDGTERSADGRGLGGCGWRVVRCLRSSYCSSPSHPRNKAPCARKGGACC